MVCALAVGLKYRFGYDDSLDVVGVHLIGGLWGTLSVGLFASRPPRPASTGCSTAAGSTSSGGRRSAPSPSCCSPSSSPAIIGIVIQKTMGFRITEEDEVAGIDSVEHAETAYDFASLGGSAGPDHLWSGQAHAEARNTEGVRA